MSENFLSPLSLLENGSNFHLLHELATEKLVCSEESLIRFHDRLYYTMMEAGRRGYILEIRLYLIVKSQDTHHMYIHVMHYVYVDI